MDEPENGTGKARVESLKKHIDHKISVYFKNLSEYLKINLETGKKAKGRRNHYYFCYEIISF